MRKSAKNTKEGGTFMNDNREDEFRKDYIVLNNCEKHDLKIENVEKIIPNLQNAENIPDSEESLARLHKKLSPYPKRRTRRIIIAFAIIALLTITSSVVVAYKSGLLITIFGSNSIKIGIETQEIEDNSKKYATIEEVENILGTSIPVLTEFSEELTINNIELKKVENFFELNVRYGSAKDSRKIRLTYKYFADSEKTTSEIDIDDTYDKISPAQSTPIVTEPIFFADLERIVATFSINEFYITLESKYSEEEIKKLIESMRIKN